MRALTASHRVYRQRQGFADVRLLVTFPAGCEDSGNRGGLKPISQRYSVKFWQRFLYSSQVKNALKQHQPYAEEAIAR